MVGGERKVVEDGDSDGDDSLWCFVDRMMKLGGASEITTI